MNNNRRTSAWNKRQAANQTAHDRPHPRHVSNGDELKFRHTKKTSKTHHDSHYKEYCDLIDKAEKHPIDLIGKPSYLVSFTKGMPHDEKTGLLRNPDHFQQFVKAIDSGDPRDFRDTALGSEDNIGSLDNCKPPKWKSAKANNKGNPVGLRAWESQSAGLAFELEGPDAQAVTMPPHPKLGSHELTAEMAEVYAQALLRDVPFKAMTSGVMGITARKDLKKEISTSDVLNGLETTKAEVKAYQDVTNKLNKLKWFAGKVLKLDAREEIRRCHRICPTPATAFRGITKGDDVGPYLSQFLLVGNEGFDKERSVADGYINYGAINIDQRVRVASPKVNYMTTWNEWLDVQHAANVADKESYAKATPRRFMYTPRDLATYVHFDALYEAYLNACLILLGNDTAFDPGIPFQEKDNKDHQQGFAHFGGPHILSLVTEVATRALKAVRFQKYNVHRRCRPEVLAARIHKVKELEHMAPELRETFDEIQKCGLLNDINKLNQKKGNGNYLLPMAFCEGSPMHPAYGAGHATVAGACVTILKAFFDHGQHLNLVSTNSLQKEVVNVFKKLGVPKDKIHSSSLAYVSVQNGKKLDAVPVLDKNNKVAHLTVEGELNKLASNISIGRNWAGVHYFTDYYESLLMGEQIALGILEEQKLMFSENFSMTVPLFGAVQ